MTSASHSLSLGIPAIGGARRDSLADANSRAASQTGSPWQMARLVVATGTRKEDGCWLKHEGSQDWQRIEDETHFRTFFEPLLRERTGAEPSLRSHAGAHKLNASVRLAAKIVCVLLLVSGAVFAGAYREAVTKYAHDLFAAAPPPQFSNDIEDGLAKAVMDMRPGLPKRIDQMTTLMWVSYSGTTMIYDNRIEVDGTKIDDAIKKKLAQLVTVNTCGSPASRKLLEFGGSYRYVYSDIHAKVVLNVDIDKNRCS